MHPKCPQEAAKKPPRRLNQGPTGPQIAPRPPEAAKRLPRGLKQSLARPSKGSKGLKSPMEGPPKASKRMPRDGPKRAP